MLKFYLSHVFTGPTEKSEKAKTTLRCPMLPCSSQPSGLWAVRRDYHLTSHRSPLWNCVINSQGDISGTD